MAIDVSVSEILTMAKTECETLETNLQSAVMRLLDAYNDVVNCVQSTELNRTITVLITDVKSVCQRLLNALPATTEFLKTQMTAYSETSEVAKSAVDSLVSRLNEIANSVN